MHKWIAGEAAHWLRAPTGLAKDLFSIPSIQTCNQLQLVPGHLRASLTT